MAKALKFIGTAVAVAGLAIATGGAAVGLGLSLATSIGGVSAGALIGAGTILSTIGGSLQKAPGVPSSQTDRLSANIDLHAFRKTVLGSTAMAADVRYTEWFGTNQERCGWIVAHASHAVESIDEIWLNDELAWRAVGGTQGRFRNYFFVRRVVLEGTSANAFSFGSGRWNAASSRLTGCAYSFWEFKVTGNSKKAESPFSSGIPTRVTVIGKGAKLYDPRRDSTVPGGSGPMRADDQTTWRYFAEDGSPIGDNLPLQILRVLLGWRINDKLATGSGLPARRIGLPSFQIAANLADERANRAAGGTEPRYHGAAVVSEGDDPRTILDMLCAAAAARFRDAHGKLNLAIMHNDLASAATDEGLNDDDVIGGFTWDPDPSLEKTPNIVRGRFTDPRALYQLVPYPDVKLPSIDGIDRVLTADIGASESPSHAQRVVKQLLQRRQYQRRFAAPFDIRAWKYNVGDLVPFTFAPLGFNRQLFRVVETDPGANPCRMILEFEHPAIYAWDRDDRAPVQPSEPIIYDSANNPIIQAIDDAAGSAEWEKITGEGKPEDGATIGAPPGTEVGGRPVGEVIATLDRIAPLPEAVDLLKGSVADREAAERQMLRDQARLAETLLRLTNEAGRTREVLRDAGIVVNPETGAVRIYAIDQIEERTSRAEIAVDAVSASIVTKASVDYVNERILAAQLDPSQIEGLDELIARVTTAETSIDGLNAAVELRATLEELTTTRGRVTTVEQGLSALDGRVSTKAEQTQVDGLATNLGSVEQTLQTLGNVSGISITIRQARAVADDAGEASLRALLAGDEASKRQITQIGEVRQELFSKIIDAQSAEAVARTLLNVRVGEIDARAAAETIARIAGQDALARQTSAFGITLGQLDASVAALSRAQSDGDSANAAAITQVAARLNTAGGPGITVEQAITAAANRLGNIEGRYAVAIDANGNLNGFELIGGGSGPGSFNLINTDLRMGTGRVIFNNGTVMRVQGTGFGARGDLITWFGPTMAISQCTRANAISFEATNGDAYFGGTLTAGITKNAVGTSSTLPNASVTTGQVGSRGRQRVIVCSYQWHVDYQFTGTGGNGQGNISATVILSVNGVDVAVVNATGEWYRTASFGVNEPGNYSEDMGGGITFYDNSGGTEVTYSARLVSRTLGPGGGGAQQTNRVQYIAIIQTEE